MQQFLKAFSDRLIQLTLTRESKPAYQVNYVEKRFYIFNTLFLLRELGYQVEEALISKYEPTESDVEAIHDSKKEYAMEKREQFKLQYAFSNRIKDETLQNWEFRTVYL